MTKTVAPVITALFGSVIRPVSDASADCAWRMPPPVHFPSHSSAHAEIIPQSESRKLPQLCLAEKENRSDSSHGLIRQIGQICTSFGDVFSERSKIFLSGKTFAI